MKLLTMIAFNLFMLTAAAQRTDVRNGMIFTDGKPFALINRDNCGLVGRCSIMLNALDGRAAIIISFDPKSYGGHTYAKLLFIKSNKSARIEDLRTKENKVAKMIVKANLFKNGELDDAAAAAFIAANPE